MATESRARVDSAMRLIEQLDFEVEVFAKLVAGRLRAHPRLHRDPGDPGVGPILAGVFVAEIGDIGSVARPGAAGQLGRADPETPRVRHHRAPWADHQAGLAAGPLGRSRGRATATRAHPRGPYSSAPATYWPSRSGGPGKRSPTPAYAEHAVVAGRHQRRCFSAVGNEPSNNWC